MCDLIKLEVILMTLCVVLRIVHSFDDSPLFSVSKAPKYLGVLQDHRAQPLSVEPSGEYMDQDYIATNRKRHRINWNTNTLDNDDLDEDDSEEDYKDKDVKLNAAKPQVQPV